MIQTVQKTLKITAALAICLAVLRAQGVETSSASKSTGSLRVAPQVGVSSFAMKAEGVEIGAQSGLLVGASGFYGLGVEGLDAEFGLQFLQTGGLQKGYRKLDGVYQENSLTMSYLAVPLGLRWKIAPWGSQPNSSIYLKGAIVPAFLMSSTMKVSAEDISIERDIKSETNSFDLMGQVGLGGSYEVGNGQEILIDLDYMRGTKDVLKDMKSANEGLVASVSFSMSM